MPIKKIYYNDNGELPNRELKITLQEDNGNLVISISGEANTPAGWDEFIVSLNLDEATELRDDINNLLSIPKQP